MIVLRLALAVLQAALTATDPPGPRVDSTVALSAELSDSSLTFRARTQADSVRSALGTARARAAAASNASSRTADLEYARRLAAAYAAAWNDSFYVREVARFAAASPSWQRRWANADSLRRAGVTAVSRTGVPAAMRLWRKSLAEFSALRDSAGRAAAIGSLGAGWYLQGELDSAQAYLDRALRLATVAGDRRTQANVVGTLASVEKDRGKLKEARTLYERALVLRPQSGDARGAAADENNLGLIAQTLGDLEGARRAFSAALADNRAAGRTHSAAVNLTNLANLASVTGDSPGADSLYRQALALHASIGERDDAAIVLHNLALLQMRRMDYDGARRSLMRSLALSDSTGAQREHASALADLAVLEAATGDLQTASRTLRGAERVVKGSATDADLDARLALTHAELSVAMNALDDAEREYARAAKLAADVGDPSLRAEAQRGAGLLLIEREQYAAAIALLSTAVRHSEAGGDRRATAASRMLLGYAQGARGDTALARRTLSAARTEMRALRDPAGEATALAALGDLALRGGAPLGAEEYYRAGIAVLGRSVDFGVLWRLHAGLGAALAARGALPEASAELRIAIALSERTAATLVLEEQRAAFRADKWEAYAELALTEQRRGRVDEAFIVSEQLRARQALAELDRGPIRFTEPSDSLAAREQMQRQRVAELTRLVADDPVEASGLRGAESDSPSRDAAREALGAAEREYTATLSVLRAHGGRWTIAATASTASWREVAARLAPDEALLEYLVTDTVTTLFVVTADTISLFTIDVRRRDLAALVDYARDAIARPGTSPRPAWRAPLERLHELLIGPAEEAGVLADRRRLIVVPHAELHYLPFAALLSRNDAAGRFLVERYAVVTVPSASLWLRLLERGRSTHARSLFALAPRTAQLPASRAEVDAIAALYGSGSSALFDSAATRQAFLAGADRRAVIHIATLGVLNKHNPLFSFVELAPAAADDGRLTVADVLALHLDADIVTLSACQTGLGSGALADVPEGDDWVGFTGAFLQAGAHDVLATLWPVEDGATAVLMERFYRDFERGGGAADALAEAQRQAIRDPARASPFRWAGFVLTGAR